MWALMMWCGVSKLGWPIERWTTSSSSAARLIIRRIPGTGIARRSGDHFDSSRAKAPVSSSDRTSTIPTSSSVIYGNDPWLDGNRPPGYPILSTSHGASPSAVASANLPTTMVSRKSSWT